MADIEFDPAAFVFRFPVWVCAHKDNPDSLMGGTLEGGHRYIMLFTDEDLAQRYIVSRGLQGTAEVDDVPDRASLIEVLKHVQQVGITHAVFDDPGETGTTRVSGAIAYLLERLEGKPHERTDPNPGGGDEGSSG